MPLKHATRLRTIPSTNLNERKRDVLRIHKENMTLAIRLGNMKAK